MITFIPFDTDNVIGISIDGWIETADMDQVADACKEKLARHRKLRVYAEVPSFAGIAVEAFFEDLKMGLAEWDRCEKEAIVTDEPWLAKITAVTGRLVPGLEVKVFSSDQAPAAKAWIAA